MLFLCDYLILFFVNTSVMRTKRKYLSPRGRLILLITEECLCNASGDPQEFGNIPEAAIEDWDDGMVGYSGKDL